MERHINSTNYRRRLPRSRDAGDYVYITGTIYTARDAAHKRMDEASEQRRRASCRYGKDQAIYYMGPSPAREGQTRSVLQARQQQAVWISMRHSLLDLGQTAMIGKGKRSQAVMDAVVRNGCVYLAASRRSGCTAVKMY